MLARARGRVGVDGVPDLGAGRRAQIVAQAGIGGLGPAGDALQFVVVGVGEKTRAVGEGLGEAGRAEVVGFTEQDGGAEIGVAGEGGIRLEKAADERKVLGLELFLQGNRVRRDDQLALLIDGVDDAGGEVGEGFSDAGAGFKEERGVRFEDGGDGARHRLLLRAVFEGKSRVEPAAFGENLRGKLRRPARRRRRGGGLVVAESDHEAEELQPPAQATQGRRK